MLHVFSTGTLAFERSPQIQKKTSGGRRRVFDARTCSRPLVLNMRPVSGSCGSKGKRGITLNKYLQFHSFTYFSQNLFFVWKRNEWEAGRNESLGSFPTLQRFKKKWVFTHAKRYMYPNGRTFFHQRLPFQLR